MNFHLKDSPGVEILPKAYTEVRRISVTLTSLVFIRGWSRN